MNITYVFNDNQNIEELQKLIKKYSLFEKTYHNSRFKLIMEYDFKEELSVYGSYGNYDSMKVKSFSTVIGYNQYGNAVSLLILERYHDNKRYFILNKKKHFYKAEGFMGLYVKPRYRKKGIANEMVKLFNANSASDTKTIRLMCGVQKCNEIISNHLSNFVITSSPNNIQVWKEKAKSYLNYYQFLTS